MLAWGGLVVRHTFLELAEDRGSPERRQRSAPATMQTKTQQRGPLDAGLTSAPPPPQAAEEEEAAAPEEPAAQRASQPPPAPHSSRPSTPRTLDTGTASADASQGSSCGGPGEGRTTLVIRNLPYNFTRAALLKLLDVEGFSGTYDFVYLPIEFGSSYNFGYAFVNFSTAEFAGAFLQHFEGFTSWRIPSEKVANVSWSWSQGLEHHIERYRNSPVMHQKVPDGCKPLLLKDGFRVEFPPPTKKIPFLRRLRTRRGSTMAGSPLLAGLAKIDQDDAAAEPISCEETQPPSERSSSKGIRLSFAGSPQSSDFLDSSAPELLSSDDSARPGSARRPCRKPHSASSSNCVIPAGRSSSSQPETWCPRVIESWTDSPLAKGLVASGIVAPGSLHDD